MKKIARFIFWAMHMASWVLALYLFATGTFWGGVGCAATSTVLLFTSLFVFAFAAHDEGYFKAIKEAKEKAARETYEKERNRRCASCG